MFSAVNPSVGSSGQPQCSTEGPTPDCKPVPWSRISTGDRPNLQGRPEHPEKTHADTGRTCNLHLERSFPSQESNPGTSCYEATVLTTTPSGNQMFLHLTHPLEATVQHVGPFQRRVNTVVKVTDRRTYLHIHVVHVMGLNAEWFSVRTRKLHTDKPCPVLTVQITESKCCTQGRL